MVEISEVVEEETTATPSPPPASAETNNAVESRSQERISDANEIEAALAHITRPSAQLHLQNLITKLRKEGKALQRVAASTSAASATAGAGSDDSASAAPSPAPTTTTNQAAAPSAAYDKEIPKNSPITTPIITSSTNKYQTFPTHYFDCGQYNSPLVTVYIPLTNIGTHDKSKISCHFTPTSFDLIVSDFHNQDGKKSSYRLLNDNLEKDIDVSKSKYIVKPNKIIIKLGKVKSEYGSYDHWTELTAKKKKKKESKKDDPAAGIMDLMKDMYDNGDDQMKKMIGETMYKQRTGQLNNDGMDGMGMGGLGDMPGLGDMGI